MATKRFLSGETSQFQTFGRALARVKAAGPGSEDYCWAIEYITSRRAQRPQGLVQFAGTVTAGSTFWLFIEIFDNKLADA